MTLNLKKGDIIDHNILKKGPLRLINGSIESCFMGTSVLIETNKRWFNTQCFTPGLTEIVTYKVLEDSQVEQFDAQLIEKLRLEDYPEYSNYLAQMLRNLAAFENVRTPLKGKDGVLPSVSFFSVGDHEIPFFESRRKEMQSNMAFDYTRERLELGCENFPQFAIGVCCFVNDDLSAPVLDALKANGVKFIAMRCMGFNNVDLNHCEKIGMKVARVFDYGSASIAEQALGLCLSTLRNIPQNMIRTQRKQFTADQSRLGRELTEVTVGVIGTGKIGKHFASLLKGFECKVKLYDVYRDEKFAADMGYEYLPLEDLLKVSDVISLHAPLLDSTRHLLNKDTLSLMKPGSYIVNTSRGGLIDSTALLQALNSGHIRGAAIDVIEGEEGNFGYDFSASPKITESDVFDQLLMHPSVITTPHLAYLTEDVMNRITKETCGNIDNLYKDQPVDVKNALPIK